MRWAWLVVAMGCGDAAPEAASVTDLSARARVPAVTLEWVETGPLTWLGAGPFDGQPVEVRARVLGHTPGARVALVAANGAATSPWCLARPWVCLDGARPLIPASQLPLRRPGQELVFSVNAGDLGLAAGDELVLQAVLLDPDGRPWAASASIAKPVQATVAGCSYDGSPDYDPAVTLDTGCACPPIIRATTAAELAPFAACEVTTLVDLTGFVDPIAELPMLQETYRIDVDEAPGMEALRMPALESGDVVVVAFAPVLREVELPALRGGELVLFDAPLLETVRLDAAEGLGLSLVNTGLRALSLPSMTGGSVSLWDNPAFETLDAPILANALNLEFLRSGPVGPLSLPALRTLTQWNMERAGAWTALDAPVLDTLVSADLEGVPALSAWSTPSLQVVDWLELEGAAALTTLSLPALTELEHLAVSDTALTSVSVPALGDTDWHAQFMNNPALCVTAEPIFAAPPPGCLATGRGNLCDP